jgi:glycosyltransferase involved in cell wall biosynthesis
MISQDGAAVSPMFDGKQGGDRVDDGRAFDLKTVELPERWPEFLAVRDELRSCRNVLVVGQNVAYIGILLMREGISVRVLDSARGQLLQAGSDVFQEEESTAASDSEMTQLDDQTLRHALEATSYDAVYITDGYGGPLGDLLGQLRSASSTCSAPVRLSVAFGRQLLPDKGILLPRTLIECVRGYRIETIDIVDGRIETRLACDPDPDARPVLSPGQLLELTELGAHHRLIPLEKRVPELESELAETRDNWAEAQSRIRELQDSTSFKAGLAFATAIRSPRALLQLPLTLVRIIRDRPGRSRPVVPEAARTGLSEWEKEALRSSARSSLDGGVDAVIAGVDAALAGRPDSLRAFAYLVAAQACGAAGRHDIEFAVALRALELNGSVGMMRGFLHVALRCREMEAASETLRKLHAAAADGNAIAKRFIKQFTQTSSYKISVLEQIPERPALFRRSQTGRFVYVLHNSLPYSSGGYATRSLGVATGLVQRGHNVVCVTRPGFPLDMKRELAPVDVPLVAEIDGVPYQRVSEPSRYGLPEYKYVLAAADRLEAEFRRLDPAFVLAASNYVTGLPSLIAARRLGIPFIYEVRGLWEITRMSRDPAFGESISFDVQRHIEGTLARAADHVFTLTEAMREELIDRGVEAERITLLPNSVDAARFQPAGRDETLAASLGIPGNVPVIGYVGTFVVYEGLEELAAACVQLHRKGHDFRLLLVGNENASGQELGPITEEILKVVREGGIESKLILTGRVPHDQVESYYSLIDVCPFPRKPWPVCEMVSPMKPLEALALQKAVVVSSVRALAEMVEDGRTGVVFEKGSVSSMADAMEGLINNPQRRRELGEAGREWVMRERAWSQVAERIEAVLAALELDRQPEHEAQEELSSEA